MVVVASLWRRFRAVGAALAGPGPTLWRTEKLRPGSPWLVIDPPGASLVGTFESRGESMSGQRFTKASSIRILVMVLSTCLITSQRTKARELPARARPKGEPSSEQITSAWASRDRSPEPHEQLLGGSVPRVSLPRGPLPPPELARASGQNEVEIRTTSQLTRGTCEQRNIVFLPGPCSTDPLLAEGEGNSLECTASVCPFLLAMQHFYQFVCPGNLFTFVFQVRCLCWHLPSSPVFTLSSYP